MAKRNILLGLTTSQKAPWQDKIQEIQRYSIKEIALFPTWLDIIERKKLYTALEGTSVQQIPHVHLRHDMEPWELDYFIKRFRTKVFNIHQEECCAELLQRCPPHANKIFVENCRIDQRFKKVLDQSAGICFDVAHQVDLGVKQNMYDADAFVTKYLQKYPIGCCHVSAIGETPIQAYSILDDKYIDIYSWHSFDKLSQLDYVRDYVQYLPKYISLELDNSFEDQLKAKQYLEPIINS